MPIGSIASLKSVVIYTVLLPSSDLSDKFDIDEPIIISAAGTVMLPIMVSG